LSDLVGYVWSRWPTSSCADDVLDGCICRVGTRHHVRGRYHFEILDAGHWLPETRPAEVAAMIVDTASG
jgi:hypothetical protein